MQNSDSLDDSPRDELCATTLSSRTATSTSPSEAISPAPRPAVYTTEPVPLYLIPQALSAEIRREGDGILEARVRRTRGHNYRITVTLTGPRGKQHAA